MLTPKFTQPTGKLTLQKSIESKLSTVFYDGRVVPEHTQYEHFYRDTLDGSLYPSVTGALQVINKPYLKQWAANRAVEHMQQWAAKMDSINRLELYNELEVAKKAHTIKLETAGSWGNDGHHIVDKYVDLWIKEGQKPSLSILSLADSDISNEGKCAALGAEKFFNDYTLFPIASERKIVSKKHRIGGTLDGLYLIGTVYKKREGDKNCKHKWLEKTPEKLRCSHCGREELLQIALLDIKTSNQILTLEYALQVSCYGYGILGEMCGIKPKINWILQLDKNKPKYTIGVIDEPKKAFDAFLTAHKLNQYIKKNPDAVRMLITKEVIKL